MDLVLFIYLASVVDGISKLLFSFGVILTAASFLFFAAIVSDKLKDHLFNKLVKYTTPTAIILCVVVTLIPSERTMYLMGGATGYSETFFDGIMIVAGDYNDRYFNGGMELAVWAGTEHNSTSIQTARPYIQGSVSEVYYRDAWIT